jgi:hypothetical protein
MDYKTCTHLYDDGHTCNSAAAKERDHCSYHLRYRARLLRIAQYRARGERFDLRLPPLESMHAVQSALQQLVEAVAADMLDLKRADFLLKSLRFAAQSLKHAEQPAPAVDLAAEFGLPGNLDVNVLPEIAFPPPEPAVPETDNWPLTTGLSDLGPMPSAGACEHGPDCPELVIRADHPVTPEAVEIVEVLETYGSDAAARRGTQLSRNRQRRQQHSDRKRFAAIALERNLRLAAEKLAERKLATARKVEPEPIESRKPPASTIQESAGATEQEAMSIA